MRARALALLVCLSLPLGILATRAGAQQQVSPEVTTIAGALDLRGALEQSGEHGCSQSFASSSARATLQLVIGARGAATLTVDVDSGSTFGPSPGRYMQGDHEFTHTTELTRAVLRGVATRSPAGLEIRFDRAERASVRFTGHGTLPLPPATTSTLAATLRCDTASVDVLPADHVDGERPTALSLLECTFDVVPAPLDSFQAPRLLFGRGAGVRAISDESMWDLDPVRVTRRAR